MIDPAAYVHPLAHVFGATIGPRTRIWQFASVIRGARLGADCTVASCAIVDGAKLGDRCTVGHGAAVNPGAEIGNKVFIGPNVTICNDAWPTVDKEGFDPDRFRRDGFVTVRIKDRASVGAGAVILPGIMIGEDALVAAGAVVTKDVPAGFLYGRELGWLLKIEPAMRERRMRPC